MGRAPLKGKLPQGSCCNHRAIHGPERPHRLLDRICENGVRAWVPIPWSVNLIMVDFKFSIARQGLTDLLACIGG